jgi:hypothetical protein
MSHRDRARRGFGGRTKNRSILDPAKILAGGIASPIAALLTSRFGAAGTMIGLALSAVLVTTLTDILKVYLARAPTKVAKLPGGFQTRHSWRNIGGGVRAPFSWFRALPWSRRRSILIRGVAAGGIAFLVGISTVTALELGVSKSLSCWIWDDCPTESSSNDNASSTSTLPSILGGGQSASSSTAPQINPVNLQQQPPPGVQQTPSQPPNAPGSQAPAPGQRESPSGVPAPEGQSPSVSPEDQKRIEDQRRGPEDKQQNNQSESPAP